jgi:hypothetical protein
MADVQARDELHELVDGLTDEQVSQVLAAVRQFKVAVRRPISEEPGMAWIGGIKDGPEDLSMRVKDILRGEMGERRGPAA